MKRIYESSALDRDDEDPFRPGERDGRPSPRASRSLPVKSLSDRVLPSWLRHRAISLDVSSPRGVYEVGERIPFTVRMKNALPVPVSVPTVSPLLWTWSVDGHRAASHVPEAATGDPGALEFDRGEWKEFGRSWHGMFRVSKREWVEADPGEYTISAAINVESPSAAGVYDETSVEIR